MHTMETKEQKERFVRRCRAFAEKQSDVRVQQLIDQYCVFHLKLTNVIRTDLPDKVMDDVRGRVQYLWKSSFLPPPIERKNHEIVAEKRGKGGRRIVRGSKSKRNSRILRRR